VVSKFNFNGSAVVWYAIKNVVSKFGANYETHSVMFKESSSGICFSSHGGTEKKCKFASFSCTDFLGAVIGLCFLQRNQVDVMIIHNFDEVFPLTTLDETAAI
jgi:hypothetical protein